MPRPSSPQPRKSTAGQAGGAAARVSRPAASARFDPASTTRPPLRSMTRPTQGPSTAVSRSEAEKAPKMALGGRAKLSAIGAATIAGR